MEDARVSPHSPRPVPTNFDVNSESGLIHDEILSAEPLSSGSNKNLTMPIQKLVQSRQRRGVGNKPKPLAGGHELLLTHQEIPGSGEDHGALRRLNPILLQGQGQKAKELVEEPNSFSHRPEEGVRNDSSIGDRRPSGVSQLQASSRSVQRQAQGVQKKQKGLKNHQGKGKGKANWHRPYRQGYRIP
ncbi:hypothetical protein O181_081901 [Austropuccinia psidii MF-1]|uniref:Uncharacterized protein n=1 Tax=Austropuccinia psidii MF-1 TaxID=1389203 RepID=A0A9Q3IGE3_9BASI|nr:hypothetical protein [Austropuccinia psidii MF-1]